MIASIYSLGFAIKGIFSISHSHIYAITNGSTFWIVTVRSLDIYVSIWWYEWIITLFVCKSWNLLPNYDVAARSMHTHARDMNRKTRDTWNWSICFGSSNWKKTNKLNSNHSHGSIVWYEQSSTRNNMNLCMDFDSMCSRIDSSRNFSLFFFSIELCSLHICVGLLCERGRARLLFYVLRV